MKDHYNTPFDPLDLSSRLNRIKKSESAPKYGDTFDRFPQRYESRSRATSFTQNDDDSHRHDSNSDSNSDSDYEIRPVTKSSTMSTHVFSGSRKSRMGFAGSQTNDKTKTQRTTAGSKGSSGTSHEGAKSAEFKYYGRHANSWLFNDFSVTDSVRRGWGKVVGSGREKP